MAKAKKAIQNTNWIMNAFILLGVVTIGLGIISLVAAHWDSISNATKLAIDFLMLLCLGGVIYHYRDTKQNLYFDTLLLAYLFLFLASIALFAQVYQYSGEWYSTLLFWAAITFLLTLYSRYALIPHIWVAIFIIAGAAQMIWWLNHFNVFNIIAAFISVIMFVPLFCAFVTLILRKYFEKNYYITSFRNAAIVTGLIAVAFADFMLHEPQFLAYSVKALIPSFIISVCILAFLTIDDVHSQKQKLILRLIMLVYLLAFFTTWFTGNMPLLGIAFTLTILALAAIYFGSQGYKRLFYLLTFLMALRIYLIYFTHLYSLATTGVGLIVGGILLIALVYVWNQSRESLLKWVEGMNQ